MTVELACEVNKEKADRHFAYRGETVTAWQVLGNGGGSGARVTCDADTTYVGGRLDHCSKRLR
jgi:hypothetical protein